MTLDDDVTVSSLEILPPPTSLNAGNHNITLTGSANYTFSAYDNFNAGTGTVILGDADHILKNDITFNNLIMEPLTAPRTITLGDSSLGHDGIIAVNGTFISGSSLANQVSFVKGVATSDVTTPVTSYYCASNGGITNITCLPGGPQPTVTSVSSSTGDDSYKSGDIISITVTFSEAVTVTGTPQLTLETGTSDALVNYASGSGTDTLTFSYTVADGHTSTDLDYAATDSLALNGGTIKNSSGDDAVLTLPTPGAANSLGDNKDIVIDTTAPTVAISSGASDPTNSSPFGVTITFDEDVTGFAVGDISVTNGSAGSLANITPNRVWTADITPSSDGAVDVDVSAGVAQDAAGNGNTAATQLSREYDSTAPTVTINQASAQTDPTNSTTINFTVVFSETVTGFATGDVTLTGDAGATTGTVTGSGTTYNVAVSGMTSAGTVTANIGADKATDSAGNGNTAATFTDNEVQFTPPPPSVSSISRAGGTQTNAATAQFTVTFSESVTGVDSGDFSVAQSGVTGASVTGVTGSGTTYTVTVNTGSGNGTLGLNLTDDDSITNSMSVPIGGTDRNNRRK